MTTINQFLPTVRRRLHSPCYLAVFDDEGDVLVELRTIHGGVVEQVIAPTFTECIEVLAVNLEPKARRVAFSDFPQRKET